MLLRSGMTSLRVQLVDRSNSHRRSPAGEAEAAGVYRYMSNVRPDRKVEGDWWTEPIPASVDFGEGFYCETAQIFRFVRNRQPGTVTLGNHVSCYAGCSFSIGPNG